MSSDFFAVNQSATIDVIIEQFREFSKKESAKTKKSGIQFIYVVDKNAHLQGYIPVRKLILEKPKKKAKEVMHPPPATITPYMDQEEVANIFKDHDFLVLPVLDEEGALLGRITIDDVVDVLEKEASEDVFKMVGLNLDRGISRSLLHSFNSRLPWLLIHLSTSILSALVIRHFQTTLEKYVVLVFFMPIVATLGGATGSQMVAMIVRGFAIGELHLKQIKWFLLRELGAVFLSALIIGILTAVFSYTLYNDIKFGLLVLVALLLNMLLSTIIGVSIPFFLKLFNFDPATGGAIMVTALTDILGFYIFLVLASIFLL